jgi:hypothetical protein
MATSTVSVAPRIGFGKLSAARVPRNQSAATSAPYEKAKTVIGFLKRQSPFAVLPALRSSA